MASVRKRAGSRRNGQADHRQRVHSRLARRSHARDSSGSRSLGRWWRGCHRPA